MAQLPEAQLQGAAGTQIGAAAGDTDGNSGVTATIENGNGGNAAGAAVAGNAVGSSGTASASSVESSSLLELMKDRPGGDENYGSSSSFLNGDKDSNKVDETSKTILTEHSETEKSAAHNHPSVLDTTEKPLPLRAQ
eukprot:GSA120T00011131001.1